MLIVECAGCVVCALCGPYRLNAVTDTGCAGVGTFGLAVIAVAMATEQMAAPRDGVNT